MSDNYTPDEAELRDCYAQHMSEYAGEDYVTAQDDAKRGIAQIKADALREAADDIALALTEDVSKAQQGRMKYAIGYLRAKAGER